MQYTDPRKVHYVYDFPPRRYTGIGGNINMYTNSHTRNTYTVNADVSMQLCKDLRGRGFRR